MTHGGDEHQRRADAAHPFGRAGRTAVIMAMPGIGDLVWHLPHLHALATAAPDRQVTLFARASSGAERLLLYDGAIAPVILIERHRVGPRGRHNGALGLLRLAGDLRRERFARVVILHHGWRYGLATRAAGIPVRVGYGIGVQRFFLSGPPYLAPDQQRVHAIERAAAWLGSLGVPLTDREPRIAINREAAAAAIRPFAQLPRPWLAFGVGCSQPNRRWGAASFAELGSALLARGPATLFLIGGKADHELAGEISRRLGPQEAAAVPVLDMPLDQVAGLLSACTAFVGNDSGMLNVAAACAIPSLGLFGTGPPLSHTSWIIALTPAGPGGMAAITADAVVARLAPIIGRAEQAHPLPGGG